MKNEKLTRRNFMMVTGVSGSAAFLGMLSVCNKNIQARNDTEYDLYVQPEPQFSFGLVADIQYADRGDVPETNSYYRSSVRKLKVMVDDFNSEDLAFAVQLGDVIDSEYKSYNVIWPIWNQVNTVKYNVVGNHDFVPNEIDADVIYKKFGNVPEGYYSFIYGDFRFIVLNTSDVSLYANKEGTAKYNTAQKMLKELKEKKADGAHSWGGAIGQQQRQWLKKMLENSETENKKVIIFSHHPMFPHALWNWRDTVELINEFDCVVACIAGHIHKGYYRKHKGVYYWTLCGMVADHEQNSYAIADVYNDRIKIRGKGRESSYIFKFDD
jgi:predicted phosphodiesterase